MFDSEGGSPYFAPSHKMDGSWLPCLILLSGHGDCAGILGDTEGDPVIMDNLVAVFRGADLHLFLRQLLFPDLIDRGG